MQILCLYLLILYEKPSRQIEVLPFFFQRYKEGKATVAIPSTTTITRETTKEKHNIGKL